MKKKYNMKDNSGIDIEKTFQSLESQVQNLVLNNLQLQNQMKAVLDFTGLTEAIEKANKPIEIKRPKRTGFSADKLFEICQQLMDDIQEMGYTSKQLIHAYNNSMIAVLAEVYGPEAFDWIESHIQKEDPIFREDENDG